MINFISAHPFYAYSAIFLAALSEAIPVVGSGPWLDARRRDQCTCGGR